MRDALQAVSEGRIYFSPFVSGQIKDIVNQGVTAAKPAITLSQRERAVLRHLAEGLSAREIGELLGISRYTVVNHRANIMRKLGLRGAAQLSLYAAQLGVTGTNSSPAEVAGP